MVDVPNQAVNEARGPGGCGKTGQRQATSWPIVMPRRRFSIVISGPHGDKTGHAMRGAMAETGVRAGRFGCRFQHTRRAIGVPAENQGLTLYSVNIACKRFIGYGLVVDGRAAVRADTRHA
ncbi:hypothetical protein [Burkholderia sp. BCC1993]|uniref:hypothetical protein n=1 Tax=Burkholderia sp. BCC1993 TaxID=2817444 RepID=UPI002AAF8F74|nr:hypothetical protein [Burkholderia sp. BCC1993]